MSHNSTRTLELLSQVSLGKLSPWDALGRLLPDTKAAVLDQVAVLRTLDQPFTAGDYSDASGLIISPSNATNRLRRLESLGVVSRCQDVELVKGGGRRYLWQLNRSHPWVRELDPGPP